MEQKKSSDEDEKYFTGFLREKQSEYGRSQNSISFSSTNQFLRFIPEERFSEEQNTDQKLFSSLRKGFLAKETQQQSQTWKKEKLKFSAKARIQCSDAEASTAETIKNIRK